MFKIKVLGAGIAIGVEVRFGITQDPQMSQQEAVVIGRLSGGWDNVLGGFAWVAGQRRGDWVIWVADNAVKRPRTYFIDALDNWSNIMIDEGLLLGDSNDRKDTILKAGHLCFVFVGARDENNGAVYKVAEAVRAVGIEKHLLKLSNEFEFAHKKR